MLRVWDRHHEKLRGGKSKGYRVSLSSNKNVVKSVMLMDTQLCVTLWAVRDPGRYFKQESDMIRLR